MSDSPFLSAKTVSEVQRSRGHSSRERRGRNPANTGVLVCGGRLGLYPAFPSFTRGVSATVINPSL